MSSIDPEILIHCTNIDKNKDYVWEKLKKWNIVVKINPYLFTRDYFRNDLFEVYQNIVIAIYKKDFVNYQHHISDFKSLSQGMTKDCSKFVTEIDKRFLNKNDFNLTKGNNLLIELLNNMMMLICKFSENTDILDHFYSLFQQNIQIEQYMDIGNEQHLNYLAVSLSNNDKSLNVIKYLIEKCNVNIEYVSLNNNCLSYAIKRYNYKYKESNLKIIKYMMDELKMINKFINKRYMNLLWIIVCRNK